MPGIKTIISHTNSPVMKRWADMNDVERNAEIIRYARKNGGKAVSLNIEPGYEKKLANKQDPLLPLRKRLHAALKNHDLQDVPLLLALEATRKTGRLHLHGVVIPGGRPMKRINDVLREGVGKISGRSGSRQLTIRALYYADGWSRYLKKDTAFTRRLLKLSKSKRMFWVNHALTRLAREDYETARETQRIAANADCKPSSAAS